MSPTESPLRPEGFARLLSDSATRFGLEPSPSALSRQASFLGELDRWRRRMNLVGDLSQQDLVAHTFESVAGETLISHGARVIDIGSGGGFPAIPLAIWRSDLTVTLVEPREKRAAFLRHALRLLSLTTAEVLQRGIEDVPAEKPWEVATTRAVGGLGRLIGRAPFLSRSGLLLAWTTEPGGIAASLGAGFALEKTLALSGSQKRVIAAFRKI